MSLCTRSTCGPNPSSPPDAIEGVLVQDGICNHFHQHPKRLLGIMSVVLPPFYSTNVRAIGLAMLKIPVGRVIAGPQGRPGWVSVDFTFSTLSTANSFHFWFSTLCRGISICFQAAQQDQWNWPPRDAMMVPCLELNQGDGLSNELAGNQWMCCQKWILC